MESTKDDHIHMNIPRTSSASGESLSSIKSLKSDFNDNISKNTKNKFLLLIISFIFMIFCVICCSIAVAYTNYIDSLDYPNYKPRLHDIIIDNIPELIMTFKFTEYSIEFFGAMFIVLLIIHRHRLVIAKRYFAVMGSIYFLRTICLISTQLTVPHTRSICPKYRSYDTATFFGLASNAAFTFGLLNRGMLSCGDYLFSGHTASLVTFASFITSYSNISWFFKLIIWLLTSCSIVCVVLSYMHYTIDVIIAIMIAEYVFISYHVVSSIYSLKNECDDITPIAIGTKSLFKHTKRYNLVAHFFENGCNEVQNEYEYWFLKLYHLFDKKVKVISQKTKIAVGSLVTYRTNSNLSII